MCTKVYGKRSNSFAEHLQELYKRNEKGLLVLGAFSHQQQQWQQKNFHTVVLNTHANNFKRGWREVPGKRGKRDT
jgi:hypothetical protein